MPKMHIEQSISIKSDAEKICKTLTDFNHWSVWSPWLIMEPGVKITVAEDGKSYSWEGNRVGSGNMSIAKVDGNEHIEMNLQFLKPWKSKAKVAFDLKQEGESTKVTWLMDSSLPFFLFWMKKMMEAMVGMDYQRGLQMFKDFSEIGKVPSKLDFKGKNKYEGTKYIGITTECLNEEIGEHMKKDFSKLSDCQEDDKPENGKQPFSIYHKMDMVKGHTKYTVGIPVEKFPDNLDEGIIKGEIPSADIYSIVHKGPYKHLGNAWSAGYMMKQNKELKFNSKVAPFEIYLNDPNNTPEEEIETQICFPVK